ncbi:MAG: carbon-nitrogen hydrolase family protein [Coxiellaceae bacterium]|nr:carbon-nitrogen hydrolase family protein [Coxiellaceae bacterium]
MSIFKLALLQMDGVRLDVKSNTEKATLFCHEAAKKGAHLAVFPEMYNIAYPDIIDDPRQYWEDVEFNNKKPDMRLIEEYRGRAIDLNDTYLNHFRDLAKQLKMAIAVSYMGKGKVYPTNALLVIDRLGKDVINYAKIHLFAPNLIDAICESGENLYVHTLDTQIGPVELGAMVCADRDVPEPARILMKKGAEIVIITNSCPLVGLNGIVLDMIKVRAYENAMAVAVCNYPEPIEDGHSTAFYPDASIAVQGDTNEGVFIAEYDLEKIRSYRSTTMMGDAFREEKYFSETLGGEVKAPFRNRKNALGENPQQYHRR